MVVHKYYFRDTRVRRYAEALAGTGAQVDVLSLHGETETPPEQKEGIRVYAIPLHRGYEGRGNYLLEYGAAFVLFTVFLLVLYIKNRYQIIHVHNMPDFLVFTALIPRLLGAQLVLDIHDPMPEVYMSKYQCQTDNLIIRLIELQERLSGMFACTIITANSSFKNNLVRRGVPVDKITVVNNVPDARVFNRDKYHPGGHCASGYFTLIYPGTIAPRYGLDVPIRALPQLVTQIPRLRLVIIGPPTEHAKELAALAEHLKVSSYVEFRPPVPTEEVPHQIAYADVGIYTAIPDPHMSIATPTKVLEYAVMGIPIIAPRLEVLEALFLDSAIMFFEPGNVGQFACCVLELFSNPSRRAELVQKADSSYVRTVSWSYERRMYFNVLNRLLAIGKASLALDAED